MGYKREYHLTGWLKENGSDLGEDDLLVLKHAFAQYSDAFDVAENTERYNGLPVDYVVHRIYTRMRFSDPPPICDHSPQSLIHYNEVWSKIEKHLDWPTR